jgi:single-stranded-DNA-specific exonuclease
MKRMDWRFRRETVAGQAPWRMHQEAWDLGPAAARLAWLRGLDTPGDLAWRLDPSWERSLDPHLLTGMGTAVAAIQQAVAAGTPVTVYGDYDVDGVTATALLVRVLERLGARVEFFIPNRFNDGYGLHLECVQELAARGPRLIVTVDCGVRSASEVAAGRELGLDWVITDHHALGEALPPATVIHPGLGDYPNPHLAGVGVAFKLAQALLDAVPFPRGADAAFLDGLTKLVALGTVADMVPLLGENALLVQRGLRALGGPHGAGLTALLGMARIQGQPTAQALAFGPAPRLNAVGRMGGAEDAVRLLLARDPAEAQALAARVETLNQARKEVQRQVDALLPEPDGSAFDLVLHPEAHKGVLGIVAAQRMHRTGRPAGVGVLLDGIAHCSLRAPEGYDCGEMLAAAGPFLRSGGGHRAAAGMTFEASRLPFVRRALQGAAARQSLGLSAPACPVDGSGTDLVPGAAELARLEPFGQGFPEAMVLLEGTLRSVTPFGQGHARLRMDGVPEEVTWFSAEEGHPALALNQVFRCAAAPQDHPRFGRSWRLATLIGGRA